VLTLANDEKSVLSGSWDGMVYDWDLNTGQDRREFPSSSGQISSVAFRPMSIEWQEIRNTALINGVSGGRDKGLSNGVGTSNGDGDEDAPGSPVESTRSFGSLFGDDDDMGMGEEDEMSRAITNGLGGDLASLEDARDGQSASNGDTIMTDNVTRVHTNEASGARNNSTNGGLGSNGFLPTASASGPSSSTDQNVFLASSMDGTLRIWDIREPNPVAVSTSSKGVPPWCMNSCWSTNGNFVYAGRRNGTVEEFSLHRGIGEATRTLKFPQGSGPVSALTALPNGRHLIWFVPEFPQSLFSETSQANEDPSFTVHHLTTYDYTTLVRMHRSTQLYHSTSYQVITEVLFHHCVSILLYKLYSSTNSA